MSLAEYHRKRHFQSTAEPKGKVGRATSKSASKLSFVIQKHAASHLHYDFRLELDGVLVSWAVPKGPSLNPAEKRLAVHVEDHPLEYAKFEGTIPEGEYGAGQVIVWDRGTWTPDGDPHESLRKGKLEFELHGERLSGNWRLIQLRGREKGKNWLLIKRHDDAARDDQEITERETSSVVSNRTLDDVLTGKKVARRRNSPKQTVPRAKGAKTKKVKAAKSKSKSKPHPAPEPLEPQLARLAEKVPVGDEWIHEIKYDGYRRLCAIGGGGAKLYTRNQLDWTHRFSAIATAAGELPVDSALLDGEIVALDENGVSNFQALQNSLQGVESRPLVYYAFDLLQLNGEDLRTQPLVERKAQLQKLLPRENTGRIRYSDHLIGQGEEFLQHSCRSGLEGIICKRGDRPYTSGRNDDWLKVKCQLEEEFVIGGFTMSAADKRGFGALLLGYFQGRQFIYAGRVGTGFNAKLLVALRNDLEKQKTEDCPFDPLPARERGTEVRWVRPTLVAQIRFTGWTEDRLLRHPAFLGLREDKTARSVGQPETLQLSREAPAMKSATAPKTSRRSAAKARQQSASEVDYPLTNPDRILWPEKGITKLELATYYQNVAEQMLPFLKDRPLSLLRCPEGQAKTCFFQKHAAAGTPQALRQIEIEENDGPETYLIADDLEGLLSLAQMGVLEIHTWGSRADRLDQPDWFVIDLDPSPEVKWDKVVETGFLLRDWLAGLDLQTFPKLTGGKGLHVVAPLAPRRARWEQVKEFTQRIAQILAEKFPDRYIAKMSKAARRGKIFVDYLRNDPGSTSISNYSTRAKPTASVAVPIAWMELDAKSPPDRWNVENMHERLGSLKRDPWEGFFEVKQTLPKKLAALSHFKFD